jgi:hypothetical protein
VKLTFSHWNGFDAAAVAAVGRQGTESTE